VQGASELLSTAIGEPYLCCVMREMRSAASCDAIFSSARETVCWLAVYTAFSAFLYGLLGPLAGTVGRGFSL
jgi:hypothetical protein